MCIRDSTIQREESSEVQREESSEVQREESSEVPDNPVADKPAAPARWRPNVLGALQYRPVQADVEYDRPVVGQIKDCTIKVEKVEKGVGYVVRDAANRVIRCFADTNNDNRLDQWRYYRNGIESYREVDSNFNGKADQYRWLGEDDSPWGLDTNEDGRVDI